MSDPLFVFDARLIAYFCFTTLNALSNAVHEDPHSLLYTMLAWRIASLVWLWHKGSNGKSIVLATVKERFLIAVPLMGVPMYWIGVRAPHNWESNVWSSLVDAFMAVYVVNGSNHTDGYSTTVLNMYSNFYTAAGFWKINTHFLDPASSCATVFMAQQLTYFAGFLSPSATIRIAKTLQPWFPTVTIVIELSMGIGLVLADCSAPKTRNRILLAAVTNVLVFHLLVCLTPRPHDISSFAMQCACRLALIIPDAWKKIGRILQRHATPLITVAILGFSYGVQNSFTPNNWDFCIFAFVAALEVWALIESQAMEVELSKNMPQSSRRPLWMWLAVAISFFYSFGTIPLGLMEEASPNMFANLKIHGGSNHFMPTGLLLHWAASREAQGDLDSFLVRHWGGGEIRLESTTSEWLTEIYPNDLTHTLEPKPDVVELLQDHLGASIPGVMFNSGVNRVLRVRERGWVPPPPHGQFISYTVPALEWKRLLNESLNYKGHPSFTVEYVHLPGTTGDETWRAFAWERRVRLEVVDGKVASCSVEWNEEIKKKNAVSCGPNEIPNKLDSVPFWLSKLSLYHGYPILYNADGSARRSISCFGP